MKIEIWVGRIPLEDKTYTLEFNDEGTRLQYLLTLIAHDKDGKEVERKAIGIVNKSDITRIAKAS